jgi:hypothetical protein
MTEPAAEPMTEPAAEPMTEPAAEPMMDGGAEANPETPMESQNQQELTVVLRSLNPQVPAQTFAGAKVCEEDTQNCVNADANANAKLMLEVGKEVYISIEGASSTQGIYPTRFPVKMPNMPLALRTAMFLNQEVQGLFLLAGIQADPAKGSVGINTVDAMGNPQSGVSLSLTPASGQGPYYLGVSGTPDPALTATSPAGIGFFANTDPAAPFLLKGTHSSLACRGFDFSHLDANGDVRLTVKAGQLTLAPLACQ